MKIGVAGSVGLDHLMTFPGKFTDSLVAGSLEKVSLSFLVDGLDVRRGGCAGRHRGGVGGPRRRRRSRSRAATRRTAGA